MDTTLEVLTTRRGRREINRTHPAWAALSV